MDTPIQVSLYPFIRAVGWVPGAVFRGQPKPPRHINKTRSDQLCQLAGILVRGANKALYLLIGHRVLLAVYDTHGERLTIGN